MLVLLVATQVRSGIAAEIAGIDLPDHLTIGKKACELAGAGVRKKLFIKVYAAGFYIEKPADFDELVNADREKAVLMHFVYRKVAIGKLNKAWRDGFAKNTPDAGPDLKKRMNEFIGLFRDHAVSSDRILLTYQPGQGTTVAFNEQQLGTITGHDFNRALMKVWFGENPADLGLKNSVTEALKQ